VADALEIARKKNLFAHSAAQHPISQSMKIVQRARIAQFVPNVRIVPNGQLAQSEMINLKSVENQNAHLGLIDIQKLNVLKNQIAQQSQIALIHQNHLSLLNQNAL
jgi:hypothetical protein